MHIEILNDKQQALLSFGEMFSDKLFRSQLSYFDDVDYTEAVDYLIPDAPSDEEVKSFLCEIVTLGVL